MSQSFKQPETDPAVAPNNVDTGAWLEDHFPLHKAVFHNDLKTLAKMLRENPDINVDAQDTHGNTALHIAAVNIINFIFNSKKIICRCLGIKVLKIIEFSNIKLLKMPRNYY